jgi:hypothetical protein
MDMTRRSESGSFVSKEPTLYGGRLSEISWQERQFRNQTFDDELVKVDIEEIRELLKQGQARNSLAD